MRDLKEISDIVKKTCTHILHVQEISKSEYCAKMVRTIKFFFSLTILCVLYDHPISGCDDGEVKLVSGTDNEGIILMCFDGLWSMISQDSWENQDAKVACRSLGYPTLGYYNYNYYYCIIFIQEAVLYRCHNKTWFQLCQTKQNSHFLQHCLCWKWEYSLWLSLSNIHLWSRKVACTEYHSGWSILYASWSNWTSNWLPCNAHSFSSSRMYNWWSAIGRRAYCCRRTINVLS